MLRGIGGCELRTLTWTEVLLYGIWAGEINGPREIKTIDIGSWEDGDGEPMQDDADVALAWITSKQAQGEPVCTVASHWNSPPGFEVANVTRHPPYGTKLFTHQPDDTALLEQALKSLKYYVCVANVDHSEPAIVAALKKRLGET